MLLEAGADHSILDFDGNSILHNAVLNNKPGLIKLAIDKGLNLNLINNYNSYTPLDYALVKNNQNIYTMLKSAGAFSTIEQAKYPSKPAPQSGRVVCATSCTNGDCYRTYSNGKQVRFQAQQKFNPFNNQFDWDAGSC